MKKLFDIFRVLRNFCFVFAFSYMLCEGGIFLKRWPMGGLKLYKLLPAEEQTGEQNVACQEILAQSFRYLSRGTQCFVFESKDRKYILKILRSDRLQEFQHPFFSGRKKQHKGKKEIYMACNLAFFSFAQTTATLAIHLHETKNLPFLVLKDSWGKKKKIDLNSFCFVLQKKGKDLKNVLQEAKRANNTLFAKNLIYSFFDVINTRSKMQISNSDPNFFDNFLVVDKQIKEVDFGDFFQNPALGFHEKAYLHEIEKFSIPFRNWFVSHWPEMVSDFDKIYLEKVQFHQQTRNWEMDSI